ncbi:MAG: hypothetical protein MPJ50_15415 [Pirellulales bacterium]|nr:hypothetical protein [Pirellulales bacterium]
MPFRHDELAKSWNQLSTLDEYSAKHAKTPDEFAEKLEAILCLCAEEDDGKAFEGKGCELHKGQVLVLLKNRSNKDVSCALEITVSGVDAKWALYYDGELFDGLYDEKLPRAASGFLKRKEEIFPFICGLRPDGNASGDHVTVRLRVALDGSDKGALFSRIRQRKRRPRIRPSDHSFEARISCEFKAHSKT